MHVRIPLISSDPPNTLTPSLVTQKRDVAPKSACTYQRPSADPARRRRQACRRPVRHPILNHSSSLPLTLSRCRYIPEGTQIYVPPYSLHRDPRYFSPLPDTWRPERWLPASEHAALLAAAPGAPFALHKTALIPFSAGPANCVGQRLALLEIRTVACALLRAFDVSLAKGFEASGWEEGMHDTFVTSIRASLPVTLKAR